VPLACGVAAGGQLTDCASAASDPRRTSASAAGANAAAKPKAPARRKAKAA
jgi:hypothetical protein